jgi:hypothetical protein
MAIKKGGLVSMEHFSKGSWKQANLPTVIARAISTLRCDIYDVAAGTSPGCDVL